MPWPLPRKKKSWANEHGPCAQEDNGGRAFRPPPCRHHHGWQRPLGEAAFPAAHHGSSQGCGGGAPRRGGRARPRHRSEEHTSELQSLMRNSYAVFCLKKKKTQT